MKKPTVPANEQQSRFSLASQSAYAQQLIENMQEGFSVITPDGIQQQVNPAFCNMTGFSADELLGQTPPYPYWPEEQYEAIQQALAKALIDGVGSFELIFQKKNGERFPVLLTVSSLRDEQGNALCYFANATDISAMAEAQQASLASRDQFASLVNNIPGITYRCLFDEQWTMLYMSDQVDLLSGYPAQDFIQNAVRSYESVIHSEDSDAVLRAITDALQTGQDEWRIEYRILHRDGRLRWAHERGSAQRDETGTVRFLDGFILDITENKESLFQLQRQLEAFTVLNQLAGSSHLPPQEQISKALTLGASYLQLELGIVSRIRDKQYEIRLLHAPRDLGLRVGQCFDLNDTYCDLVMQRGELIAIDHMKHSLHRNHPCYQANLLESYIGISLDVDGKHYGTLNFSSRQPRQAPFSDVDRLFVRLLARWIAATIERDRAARTIKQSETRLRGLFELSPMGIALNDYETGAFIDLNEALLQPTGYTREEFVALSYWDLTPQEYAAQEAQQLESMEKTGRYGTFEKEYIRKDGSRYPVLLNGMVVYDSNGRKLIWSIIENISERKRLARMKDEFVSTVSHELRTPLTSIYGVLDILASGKLGQLSDKAQQMVEIARKNSKRLELLLNDLLDMEKLVAGKMRFEMQEQHLFPLLTQAVRDNQGYADSYGVRLVVDAVDHGYRVAVDANRLQQVLANLLSNAVKFSPKGDEVLIAARMQDGVVRVSVQDHGPGIPAEFHDRIFQKFAQADSSDTRQQGGTGLGLAISRELIERMDGSIGFASTEGKGATFWFELPISSSPT